ncbi:uncharacterized protein RCH25_008111 [Pelodytes ibericus]
MEANHGFEVGAEIELEDGVEVMEETASIKVENKQNLPTWQTVHCFDELSSDEDPDHRTVLSSPPVSESLETFSLTETETQTEVSEQDGEKISTTSLPASPSSGVHIYGVQLHRQPVLWNTSYLVQEKHAPPAMMPPHVEEPRPVQDFQASQTFPLYQLASNSNPTFSQITLSQEEKDQNFSYYNVNTNFRGYVKPMVGNHKCARCGRHFRRLCNLEKHLCLKMAMGFPVLSGNKQIAPSLPSKKIVPEKSYEANSGSVEMLEQMCAQAQKELQMIQQQYSKVGAQPLYTILKQEKPPVTLLSIQEDPPVAEFDPSKVKVYKQVFPVRFRCGNCCRFFKSKIKLDRHICWKKFPKVSTVQNESPSSKPVVTPLSLALVRPQGEARTKQAYMAVQKENPPVAPLRTPYVPSVAAKFSLFKSKLYKPVTPQHFSCKDCGRLFLRKHTLARHICWNKDPKLSNLQSALASQKSERQNLVGCQSEHSPSTSSGQQSNKRPKQATRIPQVNLAGKSVNCSEVYGKLPTLCANDRNTKDRRVEKLQHSNTKVCHTCKECGRSFRLKRTLDHHRNWHQKNESYSMMGREKVSQISHGDTMYKNAISPDPTPSVDFAEASFEFVVGSEEDGQLSDEDETTQYFMDSEITGMVKKAEVHAKTETMFDPKVLSEWDRNRWSPGVKKESLVPPPLAMPVEFLARIANKVKRKHRCRDCGARFRQSWRLQQHQHKRVGPRGRPLKTYSCDCGRNPVGLLHFLRHQLQHLSDTSFVCAVCGQYLRGYRQLCAHSWLHSHVSSFQCECGAMFTRLPRYLWHLLLNSYAPKAKKLQANT